MFQRVGNGSTVAAKGQLTTHLLVSADVELSDVDVVDHLLIKFQRLVDILLIGAVDVVMALHADAVDGHAGILHLLHHIIYTQALHRVALVVVVVEEQRIGGGGVGILEGLGNELIAAEFVHHRLAIGILGVGIVSHRLIHHIPGIDHVLIARDDGLDVVLHALVEYLFRGVVVGHPAAYLRVPHQTVATQFDAVLTGKVGNAVSPLPVELSLPGLCRLGLHVVLGSHAAELFLDQSLLRWFTATPIRK